MVGQNHRGLREWLVQRITAVIIAVYTIYLIAHLIFSTPITFTSIQALFSSVWMKAATVIVVLSILWHAWIGLWTVFTDYVKCTMVRLVLEVLVILALLGYLVWVIEILWG